MYNVQENNAERAVQRGQECAINPGSSTAGRPHFHLLLEPERMLYEDVVFPPTYMCLEEEGGWSSFALEADRNYQMQGYAHPNISGGLFKRMDGVTARSVCGARARGRS